MTEYAAVSDVAREIGVSPKRLSDAFHRGRLSDARCPLIGKRRLIERTYIPQIRAYFESIEDRKAVQPC